jgi:uncharacterized membrane protein
MHLVALGGTNTGIYKLLLVLHILSAIVGLGAVMLNGLYAAQGARRPGEPGRAVLEANLAVSTIAEYVIFAIPVFGLLLVWFSGGAWKLSQTWVWLALLLYVIAIGISHAVLFPSARRINELLIAAERQPQSDAVAVAEVQRLGARQAVAGAIADLIVVAILTLMIWKPGV